jgi:hypothetical protein
MVLILCRKGMATQLSSGSGILLQRLTNDSGPCLQLIAARCWSLNRCLVALIVSSWVAPLGLPVECGKPVPAWPLYVVPLHGAANHNIFILNVQILSHDSGLVPSISHSHNHLRSSIMLSCHLIFSLSFSF